tara:strand:- start:1233 stop:1472 length:240 start_codon:yes stop_codon:yes gene_type:complete
MNTSIPEEPLAFLMTTEGTTNAGLLITGIAAAVVSVVYALRHLKTSQCCGFSCTQVVTDAPAPVVICPDGKPAVTVSDV